MNRNTEGHSARHPGSLTYTTARTVYEEGVRGERVLYRQPAQQPVTRVLDQRLETTWQFSPHNRFVLHQWRRNGPQVVQSRCVVCEAIEAGEKGEWVRGVTPAVRVLFSCRGPAETSLFLAWLERQVARGVDPLTCPRELFEAEYDPMQLTRERCVSSRQLHS